MAWLQAGLAGASLLGKLFGGAGKAAAEERAAQNAFLQRENQMRLSQQQSQQQALLSLLGLDERAIMDRAQMGITAPGARTKQALLGSLLRNLQPARVTPPAGIRMGQVSGGLPAMLAAASGGREAGGLLESQALKALASGSDVPAAANYAQRGMLPPAQLAAYKKAGKGESILSALGFGGGLLGGLGSLLPQKNSFMQFGDDPGIADFERRMGG